MCKLVASWQHCLPSANGSRQRRQAAAAAAPPLVLPALLQWVRERSFCRQSHVCSAPKVPGAWQPVFCPVPMLVLQPLQPC